MKYCGCDADALGFSCFNSLMCMVLSRLLWCRICFIFKYSCWFVVGLSYSGECNCRCFIRRDALIAVAGAGHVGAGLRHRLAGGSAPSARCCAWVRQLLSETLVALGKSLYFVEGQRILHVKSVWGIGSWQDCSD